VHVRIGSNFGDVPLSAGTLRRLPIGTLNDEARRGAAFVAEASARHGQSSAVFEDMGEGPRRGRPLGNDDLAKVAAVYRDAYGVRGVHVTEHVAKTFNISKSAAAKRIAAARKAGLLDGVGRKR
jgi:hypothetical protein